MPTCIQCNLAFPNWATIDGKARNLQNRKKCLTCSPFKNGYQPGRVSKEGEEQSCGSCARSFVYLRRSGHSIGKCNTCWTNDRRREMKQKAVSHLGGCCVSCGYSRCLAGLDFHHVNGEDKEFALSSNNYKRWSVIETELKKCVLLCALCHREHHAGFLLTDFSTYLK